VVRGTTTSPRTDRSLQAWGLLVRREPPCYKAARNRARWHRRLRSRAVDSLQDAPLSGADWRLAGLEMTGRHSGRVPFRLYAALETNNQVTWAAMDVTLVMSICVLYIESSEVIYIHLMMSFLLVVCIHWLLFHLLDWNELLVVELMSHWLYINNSRRNQYTSKIRSHMCTVYWLL